MMKTTVYTDQLAEQLQNGAIGVLPTDTIYGLVGSAQNPAAAERLYELKSREHKPGTLIAAGIEQFEALGLKRRYLKAVEQFWPGAVSVIIPCGPELQYLHQGKFSLAVRIPDNAQLRTFLEKTGPLLTTSANHPGEAMATTIEEAKAYFGDKVDFYADAGSLADHKPSTVLRIVDDAIEVLREGAVKIKENE